MAGDAGTTVCPTFMTGDWNQTVSPSSLNATVAGSGPRAGLACPLLHATKR